MIQYPSGSGYLPDFFIIGSYFVFAFTCSITFVQVSFPQIPSAVSFTFFWNAFKDVSVSFPKSPSTFTPSIACSIDTAVPLLPFWIFRPIYRQLQDLSLHSKYLSKLLPLLPMSPEYSMKKDSPDFSFHKSVENHT